MIRRFTVAATLALLALLGLSSSSPYAADPPPQSFWARARRGHCKVSSGRG